PRHADEPRGLLRRRHPRVLRRSALIDPAIFKAYYVRGLNPYQFDEHVAYLVGRAFVRVLRETNGAGPASPMRVALGRDMRLSAPALAARYADGLRDDG